MNFEVSEEARILLGSYIRSVRLKKTLGLNQLAVKIHSDKSTLSKLEQGGYKKINPLLLIGIAKGLGINYEKLYKIVGYLDEPHEENKEELFNFSRNGDLLKFPVYGWIGDKKEEVSTITDDPFFYHFFHKTEFISSEAFTVNIMTDKYAPYFLKGTVVFVDNSESLFTYEDGSFLLIQNQGDLEIRILDKHKDGIILKSLDKNIKNILLLKNNFNKVMWLGKIVKSVYQKRYSQK